MSAEALYRSAEADAQSLQGWYRGDGGIVREFVSIDAAASQMETDPGDVARMARIGLLATLRVGNELLVEVATVVRA